MDHGLLEKVWIQLSVRPIRPLTVFLELQDDKI